MDGKVGGGGGGGVVKSKQPHNIMSSIQGGEGGGARWGWVTSHSLSSRLG